MLSVLKTNFKVIFFKPWFCLAAGCFFFLMAGHAHAGDKVLFRGVVNAVKLNIRKEPSRYSDVVIVVEKGKQVDVVAKKGGTGGWLTVVYMGKKGYIRNRSKYITLKPVSRVKKSVVTKKSAPARKPPQEDKKPVEIKIKTAAKKIEKKARKPASRTVSMEKAVGKEKITTEKKIATEEKNVETFSRKEMEVIEGLNEIDYGLNQARIKSRILSRETRGLEIKIIKIRESKESLEAQINEDRIYAGQRLNALYRLGMIGRLDIAGVPSSVFDFFLTQNAMKHVIRSDIQVIDAQTLDLKKLSLLEKELKQQVSAKNDLDAELNFQIRIKEKETLKKEAILFEIQRRKNLSKAALESLRASAMDLNDKLRVMDKDMLQSMDDSSFLRQKGRLPLPVQGKIVSKFGQSKNGDYKSFTFQSGVDIRVERGEPVRAVFKGEVMFAQWLKGYGNLMIINHGDNYYTLYAHVEEIFKKKGERVGTGEVIATAGDTGSIKGLRLHFEVRHHGKPVNPMHWIRKGA